MSWQSSWMPAFARAHGAGERSRATALEQTLDLAASDLASALKPNIRMDKRDARFAEATSWQSAWMPAFARARGAGERSRATALEQPLDLAASDLASALKPNIRMDKRDARFAEATSWQSSWMPAFARAHCAGTLRIAHAPADAVKLLSGDRSRATARLERPLDLAASDLASALKPNIRMDKRDAQRAEAMSWQSAWMPAFARAHCAGTLRNAHCALRMRTPTQ